MPFIRYRPHSSEADVIINIAHIIEIVPHGMKINFPDGPVLGKSIITLSTGERVPSDTPIEDLAAFWQAAEAA